MAHVRFTTEIQGWFYIQNLITIRNYLNRKKEKKRKKKHEISIDSGEKVDKI